MIINFLYGPLTRLILYYKFIFLLFGYYTTSVSQQVLRFSDRKLEYETQTLLDYGIYAGVYLILTTHEEEHQTTAFQATVLRR